jgi:hypothetical protein
MRTLPVKAPKASPYRAASTPARGGNLPALKGGASPSLVRQRTLDPSPKVRILPPQPIFCIRNAFTPPAGCAVRTNLTPILTPTGWCTYSFTDAAASIARWKSATRQCRWPGHRRPDVPPEPCVAQPRDPASPAESLPGRPEGNRAPVAATIGSPRGGHASVASRTRRSRWLSRRQHDGPWLRTPGR